jgi:hypothetical protein
LRKDCLEVLRRLLLQGGFGLAERPEKSILKIGVHSVNFVDAPIDQ